MLLCAQPAKDMLFPKYVGPRIARYFGDHWSMHLPFAYDLIRELAPRILVELGVWKGESYFTFCQSVAAHRLPTKCFGIDTWQGDKHMGIFPAELGEEVAAYNSRYASFSTLKRSAFNEAVHDFADGSIDLLHIDGAHGYEDVKSDFEAWLPKLSERAIVLLHDTTVREAGFGVWRFWAEIASKGRSFEFAYGHGLGVWKKTALAPSDSPWLRHLFLADEATKDLLVSYYALAAQAQALCGHSPGGEAPYQSAEKTTQPPGQEGGGLAHENDLLRRESWSCHEQNLRLQQEAVHLNQINGNLRQVNRHLGELVSSAERWQERSWFKRAFHRWRSRAPVAKSGFFRKLEQSWRKRRDKLAALFTGRPQVALDRADNSPAEAPAVAVTPHGTAVASPLLPGVSQPAADGIPYVVRQERRRYFRQLSEPSLRDPSEYVEYSVHENLPSALRLIAFYLPQFHPIPENDEWWGKGFTEWTNVTKAIPQFSEHYQPHLPGELGFYDLRLLENQRRQIELAKNYGLSGFCYYYYWFNGRKLLDTPIRQLSEHPELDFPFCLCWANENWTRRWDGAENEILAEQKHTPESDQAFIAEIEPLLRDPRYIRIGGRPLIIVYRADLLPEPAATVRRWKEYCLQAGIHEPLCVAAKPFGINDPRNFGFDASVEFPPHQLPEKNITKEVEILNPEYSGNVFDYMHVVEAAQQFRWPEYPHFRGVMTSWDNEPRRPGKGWTYAFSTPERFQQWLSTVIEQTIAHNPPEERLVFINAWNEWAEGAHLEPDRKFGYGYLEATWRARAAFTSAGD